MNCQVLYRVMNKPKIFFLSTSLNVGGTEKFLETLAAGLRDKYDFEIGFLKEKGIIGSSLSGQGFKVSHFTASRLFLYLKKNPVSILHTFLYRANIIGRLAGHAANIPCIISSQRAIDAWKNQFHTWLERTSARWCDLIIANSNASKDILIRGGKIPRDKITVIYNGINHDTFRADYSKDELRRQLNIEKDRPVIACIMRLHREKGADYLLPIARELPNGLFLVAGDGQEKANLEKQAAAEGINNRFLFLGWRKDTTALLGASDIFLLPSREESFPQSILEAMAMGLPVAASDVGGVSELVENNVTGILVPPGETESFARALKFLISNPAIAAKMGSAAKEKSALFSEKRMINDIDAIYQKMINTK